MKQSSKDKTNLLFFDAHFDKMQDTIGGAVAACVKQFSVRFTAREPSADKNQQFSAARH